MTDEVKTVESKGVRVRGYRRSVNRDLFSRGEILIVSALLIVGVVWSVWSYRDCMARTCRPGNAPVATRSGCFCAEVSP